MEWIVDAGEAGVRLDKFLAAADRLGSRARAAEALARGKVLVNAADVSIKQASTPLAAGDVVRLWMDRPGSARRPLGRVGDDDLAIVYEDADLLVLNKPAGLLTVPLEQRSGAPSVFDRIEDRLRSHGKQRPFVVHRIDRDTSGLVVFARNAEAQAALKAQFLRREPERVYWAMVHGLPDPPEGVWRDHLVWDAAASLQKPSYEGDPRAKEAISAYRVVDAFPGASLIEVRLETGKRNQIRVQACMRGHTLVGERRYVADRRHRTDIPCPRQALHAMRLGFRHPVDDRPLRFEAPLPADLRKLLGRLRSQPRPPARPGS